MFYVLDFWRFSQVSVQPDVEQLEPEPGGPALSDPVEDPEEAQQAQHQEPPPDHQEHLTGESDSGDILEPLTLSLIMFRFRIQIALIFSCLPPAPNRQ